MSDWGDRKTKYCPPGSFEGRDAGKAFLIVEMPAIQAERWGSRAARAASKAIPLGADIGSEGMAAIAAIGFATLGNLTGPDVEVLLDELLRCVKVVPDPKHPELTGDWIEGSFSEPMTIAKLRLEAFNLHTNFSERAGPFISAIAKLMALRLIDIKTSLELAAQSSAGGSPVTEN